MLYVMYITVTCHVHLQATNSYIYSDRERDRQTDRDRETDRDRQIDRQAETERTRTRKLSFIRI